MWAFTQPALRKDFISYLGNVGSVTRKNPWGETLRYTDSHGPVFVALSAIVLCVSKRVFQDLKILSKVLY